LNNSIQQTPLPDDLNVKPNSDDNVLQALQKEWHAVISRNLFDAPPITEAPQTKEERT
jgi:hypothetical protein